MINKKLNKKRRLKAFRKLFVSSGAKGYSYNNWEKCLVGQMIIAAGQKINVFMDIDKDGLQFFQSIGKFYGIEPKLLIDIMFHSTYTWGDIIGDRNYIHNASYFANALRVLDALIKERG